MMEETSSLKSLRACLMLSMNLLVLSGLFAAAETAHPEPLDLGVVFCFCHFFSDYSPALYNVGYGCNLLLQGTSILDRGPLQVH